MSSHGEQAPVSLPKIEPLHSIAQRPVVLAVFAFLGTSSRVLGMAVGRGKREGERPKTPKLEATKALSLLMAIPRPITQLPGICD